MPVPRQRIGEVASIIMAMFLRRLILISSILLPMAGLARWQAPNTDAIQEIQRKSDRGELKLEFEQDRGYLRSILKALDISISSQMLVFSKSSFALHLISPESP